MKFDPAFIEGLDTLARWGIASVKEDGETVTVQTKTPRQTYPITAASMETELGWKPVSDWTWQYCIPDRAEPGPAYEAHIITLRDAARALCEVTQHVHEARIREKTITLALAIEESDRLIPPIGLCTTLLPAAAIAADHPKKVNHGSLFPSRAPA